MFFANCKKIRDIDYTLHMLAINFVFNSYSWWKLNVFMDPVGTLLILEIKFILMRFFNYNYDLMTLSH